MLSFLTFWDGNCHITSSTSVWCDIYEVEEKKVSHPIHPLYENFSNNDPAQSQVKKSSQDRLSKLCPWAQWALTRNGKIPKSGLDIPLPACRIERSPKFVACKFLLLNRLLQNRVKWFVDYKIVGVSGETLTLYHAWRCDFRKWGLC